MGKYETESNILRNTSARVCFKKAELIRQNTDKESLCGYVNNIWLRYVLDQFDFYPNSIKNTDGFIVMVNRVFEEIIFHDEFPANKIPFTLTELLNNAKREQVQWWDKIMASQLTAIYQTLDGIPHHLDRQGGRKRNKILIAILGPN